MGGLVEQFLVMVGYCKWLMYKMHPLDIYSGDHESRADLCSYTPPTTTAHHPFCDDKKMDHFFAMEALKLALLFASKSICGILPRWVGVGETANLLV